MTRQYPLSSMWQGPEPLVEQRLDRMLDLGISECSPGRPLVWFRADDVAVPSANFAAMLACFRRHKLPLALAVVPSWLTVSRWRELRSQMGSGGAWTLHQHGRRHMNHEPRGRKSEFGPARAPDHKKRDLQLGKERLETILDKKFYPVFTAPWNRFDTATGQCLAGLGFLAASRNDKALLREPIDLPEIPVNCDLHTRRGSTTQTWTDFFAEMQWWLSQGLLGIMLHHQRMNARALQFLDTLLAALAGRPGLEVLPLGDLVDAATATPMNLAVARVCRPEPSSASLPSS